jgi:hypothetical protein
MPDQQAQKLVLAASTRWRTIHATALAAKRSTVLARQASQHVSGIEVAANQPRGSHTRKEVFELGFGLTTAGHEELVNQIKQSRSHIRAIHTAIQNDKADSLTEEALIKLPPYVRRAPQPWATEAAAKRMQQFLPIYQPTRQAKRMEANSHEELDPAPNLKSPKEEYHVAKTDMVV